jgi:hypothetical protein
VEKMSANFFIGLAAGQQEIFRSQLNATSFRDSNFFIVANAFQRNSRKLSPFRFKLTRAARFVSAQHTKTGYNIPNEHKMYQMTTNCTK